MKFFYFFQKRFFSIISGEDSSFSAKIICFLLYVPQVFFRLAIFVRNKYYDFQEFRGRIFHASCPVICVGNLSMGGTGKTPMVIWLVEKLKDYGFQIVIISRGYKAQKISKKNDEAQEIARLLPEVPHIQNLNRCLAAQEAEEKYHPDVILLDDGFQHRRLYRDMNIVLMDVTQQNVAALFPRGLFREPFSALRRADTVILTRADQGNYDFFKKYFTRFLRKDAFCLHGIHRPVCFENVAGEKREIHELKGKNVGVFCGIGNPTGFLQSLKKAEILCSSSGTLNVGAFPCFTLSVQNSQEKCDEDLERKSQAKNDFFSEENIRIFPDHYHFTSEDIRDLENWGKQRNFTAFICTWKDLVKINKEKLGDIPLYALKVEMEITESEKLLDRVIQILNRR
ncbi:MAG: tetraacyldisaccharide 4'-kinase [Planctomycetia bacterium]|nr:tetraacyldisaccharide 4'-kinase [Planctomycetia bacterium]